MQAPIAQRSPQATGYIRVDWFTPDGLNTWGDGRLTILGTEGFIEIRKNCDLGGRATSMVEALLRHGVVLVKFWLAIGKDEQFRRFKLREKVEFKRFKITAEDWRNREKWAAYQQAICDMVERTSTGNAPWSVVEANDKNYARVKILRTLCERLEAEFEGRHAPGGEPGGKQSGKRGKRRA